MPESLRNTFHHTRMLGSLFLRRCHSAQSSLRVSTLVQLTAVSNHHHAKEVPRSRLQHHRQQYHSQTVHWIQDDDHQKSHENDGRTPIMIEERDWLTFRSSSDSQPSSTTTTTTTTTTNSNKNILQARTVNDTTRASTAWKHLQKGYALVYTGGDYHNARQLLRAIQRKAAKKKVSAKKNKQSHPWEQRRQRQQQQADILQKLFIQVQHISHDDHQQQPQQQPQQQQPPQLVGLRRSPSHQSEVLSFAFSQTTTLLQNHHNQQPDKPFLLSLTEFLGMIGAHQWYQKGVYVHALQNYIYPHWCVFPPTRQDYLKLLDYITTKTTTTTTTTTDNNNNNPKTPTNTNTTTMMEIGIGTGILSAILLHQNKVQSVLGTDINPYAIACAQDNLQRLLPFSSRNHHHHQLFQTNLFPPIFSEQQKVDLILCNPPWIPTSSSSSSSSSSTWLDQAVYDDPDFTFLKQFLVQAQHYIQDDGDIYLIYSNLAILLGLFSQDDLYRFFHEGNLQLIQVHSIPSSTNRKVSSSLSSSFRQHDSGEDEIAQAKAKEIISLYRLKKKKKHERM